MTEDSNPFGTPATISSEQTLITRFETAAHAFAGHLAILDRERTWTYLELNGVANAIAHRIVSSDARTQRPVALLLDNDALFVAAILGVLKAGCFYVPLDTGQPMERLRTILGDLPGATLLCSESNRDLAVQIVAAGQRIVVCEAISQSPHNTGRQASPTDPCYVLFTSGSTGSPKPIVQTHRNVLFDTARLQRDLGVTPEDRFALLFHPGFSASVAPIFGALLHGASLHMFPSVGDCLSALAQWLIQQRITICDISLIAFREITRSVAGNSFPAMRVLCLGGERVYRADFDRFRRCFPKTCRLQNAYGATEIRTVCQFFLDHDGLFPGDIVPVGNAVEGKHVLLLAPDNTPAPDGSPGEIVVRSAYLSPGYWNRPDLTAQRFTVDSEGLASFRTGDLGKWLPDGSLVHLGRNDAQVKIRGYRVEIAEVESVLLAMSWCRELAILPHTGTLGDLHLEAYLLLEEGYENLSISQIRESLKPHLPAYMLPGYLHIVDRLPRLDNGKVDATALRSWRERHVPELRPSPPSGDDIETVLTRIATDIFHIGAPDPNTDFNALGFDSLKRLEFLLCIEDRLGLHLAADALFRYPTISALSAEILNGSCTTVQGCDFTVSADTAGVPWFAFPIIASHVQPWIHLSRHVPEDQPFFSLEPAGIDGTSLPLRTVTDMAAHSASVIQRTRPTGPVVLLGYSAGGLVAHECARQLLLQGRRVDRLVLLDPLDLGTHRPLWRLLRKANAALWVATQKLRGKASESPAYPAALPKPPAQTPRHAVEDAFRRAVSSHRPRSLNIPTLYIQPTQTRYLLHQPTWKLWRELVCGNLQLLTLPGNHVSMVDAENAPQLAAAIARHLHTQETVDN